MAVGLVPLGTQHPILKNCCSGYAVAAMDVQGSGHEICRKIAPLVALGSLPQTEPVHLTALPHLFTSTLTPHTLAAHFLTLQTDGVMQLFNTSNIVVATKGTGSGSTAPYRLSIDNDGILRIYGSNNVVTFTF
jgi:hypothetical protein